MPPRLLAPHYIPQTASRHHSAKSDLLFSRVNWVTPSTLAFFDRAA